MTKLIFSTIIPVADNASSSQLETCLQSLFQQTVKDQEVIIIIGPQAKKSLFQVVKKFPQVKILQKVLSKSAARNFGVKKAKGNFLLHLDVDYLLAPKTLAVCTQLIQEKRARAIIIPETVRTKKSLWQRARFLERQITFQDPDLATPQLIEKKLFQTIGGFDERTDALDDWALHLKLKKAGIQSSMAPLWTRVHEPTNPRVIFKRRYQKGRYLPALKQFYGTVPQANFGGRLLPYLKNLKKIVRQPLVSLALLLLKFVDLTAFYLGSLNPISLQKKQTNLYQKKEIAAKYKLEQQSSYAQYKHYCEVSALLALLNQSKKTILELGAGTGRITQKLHQEGYQVTPTDVSPVMLSEFKKNKSLSRPILIRTKTLPFADKKFATVLAIRVIWHITDRKDRKNFFQEAARVARYSVILDFTHAKKYRHPILRESIKLFTPNFFRHSYFFSLEEIHQLAKTNQLEIKTMIPLEVILPLWLNFLPQCLAKKLFPFLQQLELKLAKLIPPGRWLIKFVKT